MAGTAPPAGFDIQSILDGTFGMDPAPAAVVKEVKRDVKLAQTIGACAFAVVLWDSLAYLHTEWRLVFTAKRSLLKYSYLFTRVTTLLTGIIFFIGFFTNFSPSGCDRFVKAPPSLATLPALGATLILAARNYLLWEKSTAILAFTLFLATCQFGGMLAIAIEKTTSFSLATGIKACVATAEQGDLYVAYWILPLVAHLFITSFSFAKAWEVVSFHNPASSVADRLWQVVVTKYGQVYPLLVMVVDLAQIIYFLSASDMQRALMSPLSSFLTTVLVCQMVLTLRLTTKQGLNPLASASQNSQTSGHHATGGKTGGIRAFVTSQRAVDVHDDTATGYRQSGNPGHTEIIVPALQTHGHLDEKEEKQEKAHPYAATTLSAKTDDEENSIHVAYADRYKKPFARS